MFWKNKILETTSLLNLLRKYKLEKFSTFMGSIYLRLVKMFYVNLVATNDKLSCYVMHKYIMIDVKPITIEFNMDVSLTKLYTRSFTNYNKEKAIASLFPFPPLEM